MRAGKHPTAHRFVLQALLGVVEKGGSRPWCEQSPLGRVVLVNSHEIICLLWGLYFSLIRNVTAVKPVHLLLKATSISMR